MATAKKAAKKSSAKKAAKKASAIRGESLYEKRKKRPIKKKSAAKKA